MAREDHVIFENFKKMNQVPRGSGNRRQISDFIVGFAKEQGLSYRQDAAGNVVIFKPATPGCEKAPAVMLQGHLDMVCEKTADSDHDFTKDPVQVISDGTYLWADHTTLGADDGIASAYMMTILSDQGAIIHPALECLFTVDEEIGLLGAGELEPFDSKASYMINIDNEEEHHICTSCAGGVSVQMEKQAVAEVAEAGNGTFFFSVAISGFLGGHSGTEIHKDRANAVKEMGRLLYGLKKQLQSEPHGKLQLAALSGGNKDNAIPNACSAVCAVTSLNWTMENVTAYLEKEFAKIRHEFQSVEQSDLAIVIKTPTDLSMKVLSLQDTEDALFFLLTLPNGVANMEHGIDVSLVSTSSNLGIARISAETGSERLVVSIRSNVDSKKEALMMRVEAIAEHLGFTVCEEGDYPGWEFRTGSVLQGIIQNVHREYYGTDAIFEAIHAGLECGLLSEKFPDLDMVSMGPDLFDVHTANEHMGIDSAIRTYEFLLLILKHIAVGSK